MSLDDRFDLTELEVDNRFLHSLICAQAEATAVPSDVVEAALESTGVGNAQHAVATPVTAPDEPGLDGASPVSEALGSSGVRPIFPSTFRQPPP